MNSYTHSEVIVRPAAQEREHFLLGRYWDFFSIGGLSLVYFGVCLFLKFDRYYPYVLAVYLVWLINWPHFFATFYRAYRDTSYLKEYPVVLIFLPLVIIAATYICFLQPEVWGELWVRIYFLWSPFHYSAQTFGLTSIYLARYGYKVSAFDRRLIYFVCLQTFFASLLNGEQGHGALDYFGLKYQALNVSATVLNLFWASLVTALLLLVTRITLAHRRGEKFPAIASLPLLTFLVWFIPGGYNDNFSELVPLFHSLQYLFFIFIFDCLYTSKKMTVGRGVRWYGINVIGGALLFWWLPRVVDGVYDNLPLTMAIIHITIQLLHFLIDGVLWKLDRKILMKGAAA